MKQSKTPDQASGDQPTGGRARADAALVVDAVLHQGRTIDRALLDVTGAGGESRDKSQIKALAYGALRWHHRHRLIITALLSRPLKFRDRVLEALLSVGIYQLVDQRQPEYAVVSETVDAARQLDRSQAAGLINATLRRFLREREALLADAMRSDEGRYSHPPWLIKKVKNDWPDAADAMLTAALQKPPFWIRVNADKCNRDEYAARLETRLAITTSTLPGFDDALKLDRPVDVSKLPGFAEGEVFIQDVASQLAVELINPEQGMAILDACAAPGGKATHLLERTGGKINLLTVEQDVLRNKMLKENLKRLGYSAETITGDASQPGDWARGHRFDRILVDAPCSSTGVIRRHPDIKFLRRDADISSLVERQLALLDALWAKLKPGGRMLYSTCSILKAENTGVVESFLQQHPSAREIRPLTGSILDVLDSDAGPGYHLLPGAADTDGFYYALMEQSE